MSEEAKAMRSFFHRCGSASIFGCLLFAGCQAAPDGPSATRKEQDAAVRDPFTFGPDARTIQKSTDADGDVDRTDISGGGTTELNRKALKRDWDAVLGR